MQNFEGPPPIILIVEDLDWIRSGMKRAVERQGYRIAEATDDAEAVEVLEHEPVELILTEEKLPTFEALMERLHEHPAFNQIPVVIINPDADEGARYGDAYLLTDYEGIYSLLASAH